MVFRQSIYRLIGLDGRPHSVLDAPYESLEAAIRAAREWCNAAGNQNISSENSVGVQVMTMNGSWRTVCYPNTSMQPA